MKIAIIFIKNKVENEYSFSTYFSTLDSYKLVSTSNSHPELVSGSLCLSYTRCRIKFGMTGFLSAWLVWLCSRIGIHMNNNQSDGLQKRIEKLKTAKPTMANNIANQSQALNIVAELLAGVIVGVLIGLFFDKIFDSKPLFLIICLIAGNVASFYTIWQRINNGKNDS